MEYCEDLYNYKIRPDNKLYLQYTDKNNINDIEEITANT